MSLRWGKSTVETSCPLDCPDGCSLDVSVEKGKVVEDRRLAAAFADQRLHLRQGARVRGSRLRRAPPALPRRPQAAPRARASSRACPGTRRSDRIARANATTSSAGAGRRSDPAVLLRRLERPAHAGHQRRPSSSAASAPRASRARSAPRRPAPPRMALYGKMAGVSYRGLSRGEADRALGREPDRPRASTSCPSCARRSDAAPRWWSSIRDARRSPSTPTSISRSGPAPTSPSRSRCIGICSRTGAADTRSSPSTRLGADELRTARRADGRSSAPPTVCRRRRRRCCARARSSTRRQSPAVIRCGWGLERNRNGGHAVMAVLALPAVGRQVRRPRRRLLDEQLRQLEARLVDAGSAIRRRRRASST